MRAANRALFAAKRLGRDRCVVHHAETLAMLDALADDRAGEQLAAAMLLAETLDLRDVATARHSETVGRYAEQIAHELGLGPTRSSACAWPACCTTSASSASPTRCCSSPARSSAHEWEEIKRHPELGARILEHANLRDVASWVLSHHERLDGAGYPRALAGESIPLEGRILAVADAYEAMTADRPYRCALTAGRGARRAAPRRRHAVRPAVVAAFERVLDAD